MSWPPSDLQRFSARLVSRRDGYVGRYTGDFSSGSLHLHGGPVTMKPGHQKVTLNHPQLADDRNHLIPIEKVDRGQKKAIGERPSRLSTASTKSNSEERLIPGYELSTGARVSATEILCDKQASVQLGGESHAIPEDVPDDHLHGWRLAMLIFSLMLGQLMTSFDGNVITTAIPRITSDFKSLDQVSWYGSAYFMTAMGMQPLFGRAFQLFPTRSIFLVAVALMVLGAIFTAAAPESIMFIVGRAITGAAVSAFYAGGATAITFFVPFQRRPMFLSLSMAMNAVASVLGPVASGFLTDSRLTWRFAFWINLPIAVVVTAMGLPTFRTPNALKNSLGPLQRLHDLDIPGTILMLIFSGVLVYLLQPRNFGQGPLSAETIIFILCLGALLASLLLFIYRQYTLGDRATVPLSVISRPAVCLCCIYVFLMQTSSVISYYLPIYYQAAKSETAKTSGIHLVSLLVAVSVAQFISATTFMMVKGRSSVAAMICGAMLLAMGAGLLTLLDTKTPQGALTAVQILAGLGMGFGTQMPLIEAQRAFQTAGTGRHDAEKREPVSIEVREKQAREARLLPISNSLILLSTFMGLSIGVSGGQAVFAPTLKQKLAAIPDLVDPEAVFNAGAASIGETVPMFLQEAVISAYDFAIRKAFWLPTAAAILAVMIGVVLAVQGRRR
ncbi:hypothetical protein N0V93_008331 [Gnomoniopsis smithogilvyi]|uniref:Major facilitator superfamily (MFS) profile domain-containing protein n=1 Tax=Gnomoniopsis smithogilvyi TaxID=1191159 RepID=A0A9W8YQ41_9PEZI|nr:hypothetical protein N0V93_008331 [Gnomoniopsis smithogilvyi]